MPAPNPSTGLVTDPMWWLWTERPVASWRLGGHYSNKPHYHNTVSANLANWPWSYSVRYTLDTRRGPKGKARAIDWTMSDTDMRRYTKRLIDAADRNDPRLRGVREFYGTLDGKTVVGRIRDNDTGEFRESTADSSHLWHIHLAVWAAYCDDWPVLSGVISILAAQSLAHWRANPPSPIPGVGGHDMSGIIDLELGDSGSETPALKQPILGLQYCLEWAGFSPGDKDGEYGPNTASAVLACRKAMGSTVGSSGGDKITGAAYQQIHRAVAIAQVRDSDLGTGAPVDDAKLRTFVIEAVGEYLREHPPADGKTPTKLRLSQVADVIEAE